MSGLLDTHILSELRKGPRADPSVLAWFRPIDDAALYTCVRGVEELHRGVAPLQRRDRVRPVDAAIATRET